MFRPFPHSFLIISILSTFNIVSLSLLSCSKSGENNNISDLNPTVTYNSSPLETNTSSSGQVNINSKVNGQECIFEISVKNASGAAVQDAKVTYNQSGDKVFIFVRDAAKKYNPVIVYGTLAEIQSRFGGTSLATSLPDEPNNITQPNILPLLLLVPFVITDASLYDAEYKIYKSAYKISQLLISSYQGEGLDYRIYCLTPAEIGQLQAERVGMAVDASGMLLEIVGVGVAGGTAELLVDLTDTASMRVASSWRDDLVKKLVEMGYSGSDRWDTQGRKIVVRDYHKFHGLSKLIHLKIDPKDTRCSSSIPGDTTEIQGITFVSIPGGTFQMGQTRVATPVHQVTVSAFQMSAKEITNSQYAAYLNAALAAAEITATSSSVTGAKGKYSGQMYLELTGIYNTNNKYWINYNGSSFSVAAGKENWPVVNVTWYGSKAFAMKYGFDLPREGEWEYAARGGKGYEYGTDDGTISISKANYNSNVGYPKDAGSYPSNPFGLYDLAGNVWEWCNDWYGSYSSENANDPVGPQTGSDRVNRGGSWHNSVNSCRSANRYNNNPYYRSSYVGFRVVRR